MGLTCIGANVPEQGYSHAAAKSALHTLCRLDLRGDEHHSPAHHCLAGITPQAKLSAWESAKKSPPVSREAFNLLCKYSDDVSANR